MISAWPTLAHSHIFRDNVTKYDFFLISVIVVSVYFDVIEEKKTYQEKLLLENKNKSKSKILSNLISFFKIM